VNGRDELSIASKVAIDEEYIINQSLCFDINILRMTFLKVISSDGVLH
jgi:O-antigen biosynthesis protein WbqP